ncbi:hypothetical protein L4C36_10095 [Photobacterium japonica]|uniref:hypothetical protein n=1 Tax=Photobacterium japonica TaxID=2910235 RepID=UPI003D0D0171
MVVKCIDASGLSGHFAHDTPRKISMHDDVPIWHDCCVCEAEPYWLAILEEEKALLSKEDEE